MKRETGSAVKPCPDCGAPLPMVALPDGAVTYGACQKDSVAEVAAEVPVVPTKTREYGTRRKVDDEAGE